MDSDGLEVQPNSAARPSRVWEYGCQHRWSFSFSDRMLLDEYSVFECE
jgi:hypothetical protein